LGDEFVNEVHRSFDRIIAQPDRFPVARDSARVARVKRFPYFIYYQTMPEAIVVIAVFHSARDPAIWQSRK
jgi:plasmid stabilization system protein ParE